MKRIAFYLVAFTMAAGVLALTSPVSGHADEEEAPI
jgi:hypothetical protein